MEWGDEGFKQGMGEITDIAEGDIMHSDVWELTNLTLSERNIINITALGELSNLTEGNQISDISPLGSLINLTDLYLDGNSITDYSPLDRFADGVVYKEPRFSSGDILFLLFVLVNAL